MPFDLDEMISKIRKDGLMRDNKYLVSIAPPSWGNIPEGMSLYCSNFEVPGASIVPGEYKPLGFGVLERRPAEATMDTLSALFLIDANTKILKFFQDWINNTVVFDPREENHTDGKFFSAVHYKSNYITDIELVIPDAQGEEVMKWHGVDCWPSQVSNVSLGYDHNDDVAKAQIVFQVRTWWTETTAATSETNGNSEINQNRNRRTTLYPTTSSNTRQNSLGDILRNILN